MAEVMYPETFDLKRLGNRFRSSDNQAKASNIKSDTFVKELDKQIARTVIEDDEALSQLLMKR
jgi:hypothetical protein